MNIVDRIIARAQRTPYYHLPGYMERWWLVPKATPGEAGCGPVSARKRPLAWLLQRSGITVRVHHTLRSDNERHLHDHPFSSISIVLRGGYEEVVPFQADQHANHDRSRLRRIWRGPGSVVFRPATNRHRLVIPPGRSAWSIFIMFGTKRDWGFHTERGWVHHAHYESSAWQAKLDNASRGDV